MLQTLFYIPRVAFGLPMFGFGILLFVWAFLSGVFLTWLVRKQGWNADTKGYIPVLGLIGLAICFLLPALAEDKGLPIRGYGTMVLIGVASGIWLAARRAVRAGLDPELILSLAFWMFLAGMLGARTFYVIEFWKQFRTVAADGSLDVGATLAAVVNIAHGGIVIFGAFFGGTIAFLVFVRRKRLPILGTFDLIAPSMILGLAIGRIGCFMNGCCYGGTCDRNTVPWAVSFPWNSPPHLRQVADDITYIDGLRFATQLPTLAGVEPGSEALRSGLTAGDRIVYIGDSEPNDAPENITTTDDAINHFLELTNPAATIFVRAVRDEKERTVSWTVNAPERTRQYGLKFELPSLAAVELGSEAERQGLKQGDRIEAIGVSSNSETVSTEWHSTKTVNDAKSTLLRSTVPGATLLLKIEGRSKPFSWTIAAPLPGSRYIHPTQLYASIGALALFLFLLAWYPYRRHDGELLAWMFVIYAVMRFMEEALRTDEGPVLGTRWMTISQSISVGMLVVGVGMWAYLWFYQRPRPLNFYASAGN